MNGRKIIAGKTHFADLDIKCLTIPESEDDRSIPFAPLSILKCTGTNLLGLFA
jgi:hypothetical protein